jgi:transcriptional regulator with XRE-family HTH domain
MDDKFNERFAQAFDQSGKTLREIGDVFGISPQAVSQWVSGASRPKHERLRILAAELGVNADWLEFGPTRFPHNGDESATPGLIDYVQTVARIDRHLGRAIPLVELEDVPMIQDALTIDRNSLPRRQIHSHFPCSDEARAFTMRNRSMEPDVRPGDIFVIDPKLDPVPGDLVLVRLTKAGSVVLRQYSRGPAGAVILLPANALWEEHSFTAEEWEADAKLLGVMSEHTSPRRT